MKNRKVLFSFALIFFIALFVVPSGVFAEDKAAIGQSAAAQNASIFAYQPPMRGAPAARIGGGTRGIGSLSLELVALVPDQTGFTIKEQPTLYWYVSKPVSAKLELTLINDKDIDPELEKVITTSEKAGIQSLDLSKTNAKLKPGLEYRWFVSVIADPEQRSDDIVASGTIERITPDQELSAKLKNQDPSMLARTYAEAGLWYDSIDALNRQINQSPQDDTPREQLAALLDQVGLTSAADYTRKSMR